MFRAESDRGIAIFSGEVKGFNPTELFYSIATFFYVKSLFFRPGPSYEYNKAGQR